MPKPYHEGIIHSVFCFALSPSQAVKCLPVHVLWFNADSICQFGSVKGRLINIESVPNLPRLSGHAVQASF